jgi:hypothetical protein
MEKMTKRLQATIWTKLIRATCVTLFMHSALVSAADPPVSDSSSRTLSGKEIRDLITGTRAAFIYFLPERKSTEERFLKNNIYLWYDGRSLQRGKYYIKGSSLCTLLNGSRKQRCRRLSVDKSNRTFLDEFLDGKHHHVRVSFVKDDSDR